MAARGFTPCLQHSGQAIPAFYKVSAKPRRPGKEKEGAALGTETWLTPFELCKLRVLGLLLYKHFLLYFPKGFL